MGERERTKIPLMDSLLYPSKWNCMLKTGTSFNLNNSNFNFNSSVNNSQLPPLPVPNWVNKHKSTPLLFYPIFLLNFPCVNYWDPHKQRQSSLSKKCKIRLVWKLSTCFFSKPQLLNPHDTLRSNCPYTISPITIN